MQGATCCLDNIAVHLVLDARRIDCHPRVMAHHNAFDMDFSGTTIDLDVCDPGRPGGAKARPLAVDIPGIGHALPTQNISVCLLLLRSRVCQPARFVGRGLQELPCTRIL